MTKAWFVRARCLDVRPHRKKGARRIAEDLCCYRSQQQPVESMAAAGAENHELDVVLPDHLAQRITRAPLEKQFMRDLSELLRIGQLSKPPLGIPSESPEDGTNGFGMQKGVGVRRDHVNKKKPGVKAAGEASPIGVLAALGDRRRQPLVDQAGQRHRHQPLRRSVQNQPIVLANQRRLCPHWLVML